MVFLLHCQRSAVLLLVSNHLTLCLLGPPPPCYSCCHCCADLNDLADQLDAVLQLPGSPGALSLKALEEALQLQFSSPAGSDQSVPAALQGLASSALAAAAASQAGFVRRGLGLAAGANAVVSNGRVVELPSEAGGDDEDAAPGDAALSTQDFELLELFAQRNQYSTQVAQLVRAAQEAGALGGADPSAVAAVVSSALAAGKPEEVR